MTDLEISKALSLAIGWTERQIGENEGIFFVNTSDDYMWDNKWRIFDYRDWAVAGPIAEKYNCFPLRVFGSAGADWSCKWACGQYVAVYAATPQKAIALAVIGAKK